MPVFVYLIDFTHMVSSRPVRFAADDGILLFSIAG